ncbi:MAG: hypothetical protein AAGD34_10955, partial [Pseudomonadota bacterium]
EENISLVKEVFWGMIFNHVLPVLDKIETCDEFYEIITGLMSDSPRIFSKTSPVNTILNCMVGLKINRWPSHRLDLIEQLRSFLVSSALHPIIKEDAIELMTRLQLFDELDLFSQELKRQ